MCGGAHLGHDEQHVVVVGGAGGALPLRRARDVDGLRAEARARRLRRLRRLLVGAHHRVRAGIQCKWSLVTGDLDERLTFRNQGEIKITWICASPARASAETPSATSAVSPRTSGMETRFVVGHIIQIILTNFFRTFTHRLINAWPKPFWIQKGEFF